MLNPRVNRLGVHLEGLEGWAQNLASKALAAGSSVEELTKGELLQAVVDLARHKLLTAAGSPAVSTPLEPIEQVQRDLIRRDFHRGLVRIGKKPSTASFYAHQMKTSPVVLDWDPIEAKLVENNAALLKRLCVLPGGAILVGVDAQDRLYFRQQSSHFLMKARYDREGGSLQLLDHIQAESLSGPWATTHELYDMVARAGFALPQYYDVFGSDLMPAEVAAFEGVADYPYLCSGESKNGRFRLGSTILGTLSDVESLTAISVLSSCSGREPTPGHGNRCIVEVNRPFDVANDFRGAVVWVVV